MLKTADFGDFDDRASFQDLALGGGIGVPQNR
jgi:hypothetical protein